MSCPHDLLTAYQEGRVIPFIGAGASMSVEWTEGEVTKRGPSWGELVDKAIDLLGFSPPSLARARGTDLQILEYFKRKNAGQTAKLTNWFSGQMSPSDQDLAKSVIHRELAALENCSIFYTTNFDDFLERSFKLHGRTPRLVAVEQQMGGRGGDCEIVKFHGDLEHPDQIVLTELQYEERLKLSTALDFKLRADLLGRVALFIGYSFRDPNVSYLFTLFMEAFWEKTGARPGTRAFITVPDPSNFERELFRARKIDIIPIGGSSKTQDIVALLQEMRGE